VWYPTIEFILLLYTKKIPEVNNPIFNLGGLSGTLEKVKYGIPYQPNPTIWVRVTILYKEIIENHYFVDGNKRIGSLIGAIFLNMNGYEFLPPVGEIFSITMKVAQGILQFEEIRDWFEKNSTKNNIK
jgi:death on curing protein